MSAALKAHIRLLESLPRERVTTHERKYAERGPGKTYPAGFPKYLIDEFQQMTERGIGYTEIRRRLQIGPRTYYKLRILIVGRKIE